MPVESIAPVPQTWDQPVDALPPPLRSQFGPVGGHVVVELAQIVGDPDVEPGAERGKVPPVLMRKVGMRVVPVARPVSVIPGRGRRRRCDVHPSIVADGRLMCRVV